MTVHHAELYRERVRGGTVTTYMSSMHGYPSGSLAASNHKLVHAGMNDSSIHKLPVPQVMHCNPYRYDVCRGREFKIRDFQVSLAN